jgi:hypothetical protein
MLNYIGKICFGASFFLSALVFTAQAEDSPKETRASDVRMTKGELILRKSDVEVPPELIREMSFLMMVPSDSQTGNSTRYGADPFRQSSYEENEAGISADTASAASITRFPIRDLSVNGIGDSFAVFHHPQTGRFYAWLDDQSRDPRYAMSDHGFDSAQSRSEAHASSPSATGALFLLELDWVVKDQGSI